LSAPDLNALGAVIAGAGAPATPPSVPPPVVLPGPGLYEGVRFADYLADPLPTPSLTSSIAKTLLSRSPLHAHHEHPRLGAGALAPATKAMDTGTVVHALILGGGQDYVAVDAKDWTTKRARQSRDAIRANGQIPILARQLDACAEVARRLESAIPASAKRELTAVWLSGGSVLCRRRFDALVIDEGLILDLKTCEDAARASDDGNISSFGRDLEAGASIDCADTLHPDYAGRWRFEYVFAEIGPPYDVVTAPITGAMLDLGRRLWRRAVERWDLCLRTDRWPGVHGGRVIPQPRPWVLERDLDAQMVHAEAMRNGARSGSDWLMEG